MIQISYELGNVSVGNPISLITLSELSLYLHLMNSSSRMSKYPSMIVKKPRKPHSFIADISLFCHLQCQAIDFFKWLISLSMSSSAVADTTP